MPDKAKEKPRFSSIKDFSEALGVGSGVPPQIAPDEVYATVPDRSGVYFHRINPATHEVEWLYHVNHDEVLTALVALLGVRWSID